MYYLTIVVLTSVISANADPPVEGDVALLQILRDAQQANEGRYTHGEFRVFSEHGMIGAKQPKLQMEGLLRWDQKKCRFVGVQTDFNPPAGGTSTNKPYRNKVEFALNDTQALTYQVNANVLRIDPPAAVGPPFLAPYPPEHGWYKIGSRPIVELMGPHPNFPQHNIISYHVARTGDDRVRIIRKARNDRQMSIIASLRDEGNVVELLGKGPEGDFSRDTFRWAKDPKGRCYLAERYHEAYNYDKTFYKTWVHYYTRSTFTDFNPDYRPPASLFTLNSFPVISGARVEDKVAKKNYRIGEPAAESILDQLGPLIDTMKRRGFAKPGRQFGK